MFIIFKWIFLYLGAAFIFSLFPVNREFQPVEKGIDIFIVSNGVHTDLVVPIHSNVIDWEKMFSESDFGEGWLRATYIAFGWGDRGFYLRTPKWKDLTPRTAIIAVMIPSESAMHVTLWNKPVENKLACKITITEETYIKLVNYIKNSFKLDEAGRAIKIDHPGYGTYDRFFRSDYRFHLFRTCNVWTNRGLQKAGIRTSLWSPFDKPILYHTSGFSE